MIVPEIIDDFKCSNYNQKVRISKITSLNNYYYYYYLSSLIFIPLLSGGIST